MEDRRITYHLDRVNYLSFLLKQYKSNRHPSLIGRGWEYINGKCCPVRYVAPAMTDILQPQLQALSDDDDDDGSDGEYGGNINDCDTNSE